MLTNCKIENSVIRKFICNSVFFCADTCAQLIHLPLLALDKFIFELFQACQLTLYLSVHPHVCEAIQSTDMTETTKTA